LFRERNQWEGERKGWWELWAKYFICIYENRIMKFH
jgi:hypothetical protein